MNTTALSSTIYSGVTHQTDDVPGVFASEGLGAVQSNADHEEDDEGANVNPNVPLHRLLHHTREGEHAHHAECEHQLQGQDAEHLQGGHTH